MNFTQRRLPGPGPRTIPRSHSNPFLASAKEDFRRISRSRRRLREQPRPPFCSIPLTMLSIRFLSQFYRPMIINPSNQIYNFLNLIFPTKLSTAVYSTVGGRIGSVLVGRQASFASPPAKAGSIGVHYTYTICVRNKRGG